MTIFDGIRADSSKIVGFTEQQDQCCLPCCGNYQIKASRFENEFMIETDGDLLVGHVKIYPQKNTTSAFIMNKNMDPILAIHVDVYSPDTAFFHTPSSDAHYTYAGQLHLDIDMDAGSRKFTFQDYTRNGNSQPEITIESSASSRKFQLHQEDEECASFSFDSKNIAVSNDQSQSPCDPPILLGIAFSASYFLPFKG